MGRILGPLQIVADPIGSQMAVAYPGTPRVKHAVIPSQDPICKSGPLLKVMGHLRPIWVPIFFAEMPTGPVTVCCFVRLAARPVFTVAINFSDRNRTLKKRRSGESVSSVYRLICHPLEGSVPSRAGCETCPAWSRDRAK